MIRDFLGSRFVVMVAVAVVLAVGGTAAAQQVFNVSTESEFRARIAEYATAPGDVEIVVGADITLTSLVTIPPLTATGKTLTIRSSTPNAPNTLTRGIAGNLFTVSTSATLVLENIVIDGNKNGDFADVLNGSLVRVGKSGILVMNDGAVVCNNDNSVMVGNSVAGGGVSIVDGGTFKMIGGEISGNYAKVLLGSHYFSRAYGGGVYVVNSTFIMAGGKITGNMALCLGGTTKKATGSGVYVDRGTFIMADGKISNNIDRGNGSIVFLTDSSTFTMISGELSDSDCRASNCTNDIENAAIKLTKGSKFIMDGGKISGNRTSGVLLGHIEQDWPLHVNDIDTTSTFIMNDGEISSNAIHGVVINGGKFIMNSGNITNNIRGVFGLQLGYFTMNGGEISGNTGGGVAASNFTMNGGKISGNTAESNGGGVFAGNFTMNGGKISDNTAGSNGGGVFINFWSHEGRIERYGSFTMTGGEIISNNSTGNGGGVYINSILELHLGGTAIIRDNTRTSTVNNFFLSSGQYITLGTGISGNGIVAPTSGMEIGVTKVTNNGVIVQSGATTTHAQYFFADEPGKTVIHDAGQLRIITTHIPTTAVTLNKNSTTLTVGSTETLTATVLPATATNKTVTWSTSNSAVATVVNGVITARSVGTATITVTTADGNFMDTCVVTVIAQSIPCVTTFNELTAQIAAYGSSTGNVLVEVCQSFTFTYIDIPAPATAGRTLTIRSLNPASRAILTGSGGISIPNGAALILESIIIDGAGNVSNSLVTVNNGGSLVINDGTVLRNAMRGVNVRQGGTFTMDGGEISGGSILSDEGGGVQVLGTFTMNGGEIRGNRAMSGGGVNVSITSVGSVITPGIFTMNGGKISNNVGGGVSVWGKFTMIGGEISGNTGGGILIQRGEFIMDGGKITGNRIDFNGGGVRFSTSIVGGSFTMNAGEISGNTAVNGGGVDISSTDAIFTMNGGKISGNTATLGGGVYRARGTFTMHNGEISNNTASEGGGVLGPLTMAGGKISGNKATGTQGSSNCSGGGGGVSGALTMTGGEISGNTAFQGGGVCGVGITMSGGKINNNTAEAGGGVRTSWMSSVTVIGPGIPIDPFGGFTMTAGEIRGNTAVTGGGVAGELIIVRGGEISGNTAVSGGGVCGAGVTVAGGKISGNTADDGGGVLTWWSELFSVVDFNMDIVPFGGVTVTAGEISNNTAALHGGGVAGVGNGLFGLGSTAIISDNTLNGVANNVFLQSGQYITLGTGTNVLRTGMDVGVTKNYDNGVIVRSGATDSHLPYFFADEAGKFVIREDVQLIIATPAIHVPATNITNVPSEATVGISLTLTGTVAPSTATNRTITWSIADAGATGAAISGSVLSTSAVGTVVVRARIVNGIAVGEDYTKDFTITVIPHPTTIIPVSGITGVPTETVAGTPVTLTGTVAPTNATLKAITWSIDSAGSTGAVLGNGNELRASSAGTVVVRATVIDGISEGVNYTRDFTITIRPKPVITVGDLNFNLSTVIYDGWPHGVSSLSVMGGVTGFGAMTVKYDGETSEPVRAGTYVVTVDIAEGATYGAVTGERLGEFTIGPKPLTGLSFSVDTKVYDGSAAATVVPVPLTAANGIVFGDEVELVVSGAAFASPNAGTGVSVTGQISLRGADASNYSIDPPSLRGDIVPKQLPSDALASLGPEMYTGHGVTPQVTIRDGARVLVSGVDYTVTYADNVVFSDSARVMVVGVGNYEGELSGTFRIIRGRGSRLWVAPSPASRGAGMSILWQGRNFGSAVLSIYDKQGNLVATVDVRDEVFDNFDRRVVGFWNLTNRRGRYVGVGTYLIRGDLITSDGKRERVSELVGVR